MFSAIYRVFRISVQYFMHLVLKVIFLAMALHICKQILFIFVQIERKASILFTVLYTNNLNFFTDIIESLVYNTVAIILFVYQVK